MVWLPRRIQDCESFKGRRVGRCPASQWSHSFFTLRAAARASAALAKWSYRYSRLTTTDIPIRKGRRRQMETRIGLGHASAFHLFRPTEQAKLDPKMGRTFAYTCRIKKESKRHQRYHCKLEGAATKHTLHRTRGWGRRGFPTLLFIWRASRKRNHNFRDGNRAHDQ